MLYRKIIINPKDSYYNNFSEFASPRKNNRHIHLILFLLTVLTTTGVGAMMWASMYGGDPFSLKGFIRGFPFSATIISILGVHEFAHYFAARYWGIRVTLPYFIPLPIPPIGTFGAVIKMKSAIPNRKALIDVGASGPIAGFIVAVAASIVGLKMSLIVPIEQMESTVSYVLSESLMFRFLGYIINASIPENSGIYLHPVGFAGWIGLFVTALNLMPVGQLDGGHVLFALSPKLHELIRRISFPLLILLGLTFWGGWYVLAFFSLVFFRRTHPFPDKMDMHIGQFRKIIASTVIIIFFLCITLSPIKIG